MDLRGYVTGLATHLVRAIEQDCCHPRRAFARSRKRAPLAPALLPIARRQGVRKPTARAKVPPSTPFSGRLPRAAQFAFRAAAAEPRAGGCRASQIDQVPLE